MRQGTRLARLDLAALLAAVDQAPAVNAADILAGELGSLLGATDVAFLIADFSGRALVRLGHAPSPFAARAQGTETAETVTLEDSVQGRALRTQSLQVEPRGDSCLVAAPVTNRGEAIGVLELCLREAPDEDAATDIATAAHLLAYVVIANRRYTDLFEWGQRSVPLSLAAEIQHRLLPGSYTCEAGQFTLAAWLEPAGDIAGDTFDFSVDRDVLHMSMTDAMGHEVEAAVLATVLVGALRNARRGGADLAEQARLASQGLERFARPGDFVTGQLVRVDLRTQRATIVNAGHPLPLRLRDGRVSTVELAADVPFGTDLPGEYRVQELDLRPRDRLVFVTDGVLERNAATLDVEGLILEGAELHPRLAVQHLVHGLLQATEGELKDDATVMCLDWRGGQASRVASYGSDD